MILTFFSIIFLVITIRESPLILIFRLILLRLRIGGYLFLLGFPLLCYMWILVYVGGIIIVFTYVIFFSLNLWIFHFTPTQNNWFFCFIIFRFFIKIMKNLPPQREMKYLWNSISDLINSRELRWIILIFIFFLICFILATILQIISSILSFSWKIFSF
jgi:NADH:ubiquinone oxidoreductase subunit 6 (subunit J)